MDDRLPRHSHQRRGGADGGAAASGGARAASSTTTFSPTTAKPLPCACSHAPLAATAALLAATAPADAAEAPAAAAALAPPPDAKLCRVGACRRWARSSKRCSNEAAEILRWSSAALTAATMAAQRLRALRV